MRFHRPSVHQIRVLQWPVSSPTSAFEYLARHIDWMARDLSVEVVARWTNQLGERAGSSRLDHRDLRTPLILSERLHPLVTDPRIKCALFAYKEGTSLLVHSIWQARVQNDPSIFDRLLSRCYGSRLDAQGYLGEGLMFTGIPISAGGWADAAERLLELSASPVQMRGCTLFVPDQLPLGVDIWRTAMFFATPYSEQSRAAGQFLMVEWPRIVQYHRRLDQVYLGEYRPIMESRGEAHDKELRNVLSDAFAAGDRNLGGRHPSRTLGVIAQAQYSVLQVLSEAQRLGHEADRELKNLESAVTRAMVSTDFATGGNVDRRDRTKGRRHGAGDSGKSLTALITDRGRYFASQIHSDIAAMRISVEAADRAIADLRTQADIVMAVYTRRLTWIAAAIGLAAAIPALIDYPVSRRIYEVSRIDALWNLVFGSHLSPTYGVLVMRITLIACLAVITWMMVTMLGRFRE